MVSNIRDKREVRARLGQKTIGENFREILLNFFRKILEK